VAALITKTPTLRAISPHFQRSINLMYDASDAARVGGYIPTRNGATALAAILANTGEDSQQRAHVLYAAYGSGKSLLAAVLSAVVSYDPECREAISVVLDRLECRFPESAIPVMEYWSGSRRMLPVILSGDEGQLETALTRALGRALAAHGLADLRPRTQFHAAVEMIELWQSDFPGAYERLQQTLAEHGHVVADLRAGLLDCDVRALAQFEEIYPEITAGAHFDRYAGPSVNDVFHATAQALHDVGLGGIIVIWDEFGRYLDARVSEAFGPEAALLQGFAEFCNRSGTLQVHAVLISHRLLSGYAAGLPSNYQQEWARIAERFWSHDVSSDPAVSYQLIAEALAIPDAAAWQAYASKYCSNFDRLTERAFETALFDELDDVSLRQHVIERAWPLHPLSIYALPRLASHVGQNERTLFTFLSGDEPSTLMEQLRQHATATEWWLVGLDAIWNYFDEAIRSDTRAGGTHAVSAGVAHALSKVDPGDVLSMRLIKTLGVLLIVSDAHIQSQLGAGRALPTSGLLAWALGVTEAEVTSRLDQLARRRAVIYRRADGFWNFTRGSDVDLDAEVTAVLERRSPTTLQLRQLLDRELPVGFLLPRAHNLARKTTRYFTGLYRWPDEIERLGASTFLTTLGPTGYADGAVVYVLATNAVEIDQAVTAIRSLPITRVLFAVPEQPLTFLEPLRELFALQELHGQVSFLARDERVAGEITFFFEDAVRRIRRALRSLLDSNEQAAQWWWCNGEWHSGILGSADVARVLSGLCDRWFSTTPVFNNELVNRHQPSGQQVHAVENVIAGLLSYPEDALPIDLGVAGQGPDYLVLRTILMRTGLLQDAGDHCMLVRPTDGAMAAVWAVVEQFLDEALETPQEASRLLDVLQSPPFGLRRGVLPVLLAAIMRRRLQVLTIRQGGKAVSPITGGTFTALCQKPESFTVELGPWTLERAAVWSAVDEKITSFLTPQDRSQQPMAYLGTGLMRWLQAQPRFCRDTNQVPADARRFRDLIRKAQRDPARVFLFDLPDLVAGQAPDSADLVAYRGAVSAYLGKLMDDIAAAYQGLLYALDRVVIDNFGMDCPVPTSSGADALQQWLTQVEARSGVSLSTFRFSDRVVQGFVQTLAGKGSQPADRFWEALSRAVLGISLLDWTDASADKFKQSLLDLKDRLQREILGLTREDAVVELRVALPTEEAHVYRFRPSELSVQGQRILDNFKSTLQIAGRPLSPDERRQVVLALLYHILDGSNGNGHVASH
jgi:hypothetical protein